MAKKYENLAKKYENIIIGGKNMDIRERIVHGDEGLPVEIYEIEPDFVRYRMAVHWHPEHELLYVRRGHISVHLDDATYELGAGDTLFIRGGSIHSAEPEDCDYVCILINLSLLMKRSDACMAFTSRLGDGGVRVEPLLGRGENTYGELCERMALCHRGGGDAYPFLIKGYIFSLFGEILREHRYIETRTGPSTDPAGRLKTAIRYIEENFSGELRLEVLARLAHMTPNPFCRTFRRFTGQTPFAYITEFRLTKARYALRTTDMSVTEIALYAGFGDVSHFIRVFREAYGHTPKVYRSLEIHEF